MATDCHLRILKENRVYLVGNLDLRDTLVLEQLVQDGVLSSDQLNAMKDKCGTNLSLASVLVSHLEHRPKDDWETFISCLKKHNHNHVVRHISRNVEAQALQECDKHRENAALPAKRKKTEDNLHVHNNKDERTSPITRPVESLSTQNQGGANEGSSVRLLQQKLAGIIKQLYNKIPLWTLHSDLYRVPMEQMYVELILVKDKQRLLEEEEHLLSYKDIFNKSGIRSTIYLCGEPGVGKSTFTQHLCVEWAKINEKGAEVEKQVDDTFGNFQFVLPLFLRDIKQGDGICDVFSEAYQLRRREAEELYHHINNTDQPILIIADGLDEYCEGTSEEISKLLHRQILPNIVLFISSRFSPESFYSEDILRPDTEVALRGFSEAGVQEYLMKFFNQDQKKRDALIEEIKKSVELVHFSHYPAILLMMATLWEENQELPSTITGFYGEFVAYVFARMEKKLKKVADRAKSTDEIFERYNTQIMALGSLATGSVQTHQLELKFKREDVKKHIRSEDLKSGFLIEKLTISRKCFYIFIHKTVQEYFLAFFLVFSNKSTQKELLLRFFNSAKAFTESGMIRRFVAGLGGEEIQDQIRALITGDERDVAKMHTNLQLEYLAEHQDAKVKLPRVVYLCVSDMYPASHYVRFLSQDCVEMNKMQMVSAKVRHWRLLQHLHAPQCTFLLLDCNGAISSFSDDTKYITHRLYITLAKFQLKQLTVCKAGDEASSVIKDVVRRETLQVLGILDTPLTGDNIVQLTVWLPRTHLTSLTLWNSNLTSQEMMSVLNVLPPSLQILSVSGNSLTGLTDRQQLSAFTRSQIYSLDMSNCRLSPLGVLAVIDAAPEMLTELILWGNNLGGTNGGKDLVRMTEKTKQLAKLKTLNLLGNNLSRDVLTAIEQIRGKTHPHLKLFTTDSIP